MNVSTERQAINILSFDIEGFIESCYESFHVPDKYRSPELETREIEENTNEILEVLARRQQKATFFVLGRIGRDMPTLIRQIAAGGHEIGCHGYEHKRLYQFDRQTLLSLLSRAKQTLEDVSGAQVRGFRAPDFSIVRSNLWALDVLREVGFEYDSSIYPIHGHDVYGIANAPTEPFRLPNGLIEVPMSSETVCGIKIPFGGGGYLRLYPFTLTKLLFRRRNARGRPVVVYLHPSEMAKVVRPIVEMSVVKRLRTYGGMRSVKRRLNELLTAFRFTSFDQYVTEHAVPSGDIPR